VRSKTFVKKDEIRQLVKHLSSITINTPVIIGQTIVTELGKNKVDIIASASS
jgi:CxxC motif-containing protein